MSVEMVLAQAQNGIFTILLVAGPILLTALIVGLIVSIFQATTQIQEQTLAFIPKIVAVFLAILFFGPWMLNQLITYAGNIFSNLTRFIG